jgi:hypothetical protein
VGLNGELPATGENIDGGCCGDRAPGGTEWVWVRELNDAVDGDNRARLEIDSTGLHTLNVWMREDGQIIDKIVLTTDPNFVPSGQGPEGSSTIDFAYEDARIEFTEQPAGVTVQERQTATFTAAAEAFSGDQALPEEEILYQWQRDGEDILGATGTSFTTGELSVEDNGAVITVQARIPGARATSQDALLTVEGDDDPPELFARARGRSTLDWVTLFFSERLDPDSATTIDNYSISSDSGDLGVTQATLSADGTKVFLETDPQTVGTRYIVTVNNVTDIAAEPNTVAPDSEAFFFGQGSPNQTEDGLVVIEAENYTSNTPQGDHTWELHEGPPGFSGIGTMYSLPPTDNIGPVDAPNLSPQLDFTINFNESGTHYLWYRGSDGGGDSIHAGFNGTLPPTLERIDGGCCGTRTDGGQDLVWVGNINDEVDGDSRARFEVPRAEEHTLNIWMREGGLILDKIIVTTDPSFTRS